jgi:spoIIIJ-associated protein
LSEEAETADYEGESAGQNTLSETPDTPGGALAYLQEILRLTKLDVQASIGSVTSEELMLDMQGPDASLLIGRHGQTLDSLQYLLLVMMSSRSPAPPDLRITVDVEGYRQRRIDTLTRYANSLAAQVQETNEEAVLEPLNSLERRIVHTALADNPFVETYSEGFGQDRHIVITPRKDGTNGEGNQ